MKISRLVDHVRQPSRPSAPRARPRAPHFLYLLGRHSGGGRMGEGRCPHPSFRTFQELAEVKVVLHDHVRDHLLVEADDLEEGGFQKNGFCIV